MVIHSEEHSGGLTHAGLLEPLTQGYRRAQRAAAKQKGITWRDFENDRNELRVLETALPLFVKMRLNKSR